MSPADGSRVLPRHCTRHQGQNLEFISQSPNDMNVKIVKPNFLSRMFARFCSREMIYTGVIIFTVAIFLWGNESAGRERQRVVQLPSALSFLSKDGGSTEQNKVEDDEDLMKSLEVPVSIDLARDLDRMYGRKVVIKGLDRCAAFREAVPPADRFVSAAGMFNTGTHVIFNYLDKYCEIPDKDHGKIKKQRDALNAKAKVQEIIDSGILFETYWGKHKHVTDRGKVVTLPKYEGFPVENLLPVVMIKDPFTWLSSMCRNPYNWIDGRRYVEDGTRCPNLTLPDGISPVSATIKYSMRETRVQRPDKEFESMLHMYNQWYQEWEEVAFPRLIVRYEDLLLHPEEVVDKVCSCAGGSWKEKFTLSSEKAKKNGDGLEGALARYGNATKRTEGYTDADLKFAEKTIDQTMFNTYHYLLP